MGSNGNSFLGNLAYVFPGQGSQSIGMLGELSNKYPLIIQVFDIVSDQLGYNVWQLVQKGPEEKLNQTEYTQVAMLAADVAIFKLLQSKDFPAPQMMAGHSLGEYAALVCANAISLTDAASLVEKRGQLMQAAVPLGEGAMAAIIGLTDQQVEEICQKINNGQNINNNDSQNLKFGEGENERATGVYTSVHEDSERVFNAPRASKSVSPANYNALGQVVIAGNTNAVKEAIKLAEEAGAKLATMISVSVPCHCSLLKEAAQAFAEYLNQTNFKAPAIPVISNVTTEIYSSAENIRQLLQQQLFSPVQWVKTIQLMKQKDINSIIECGPGKVLAGLIKRIDKSIKVESSQDIINKF